MKVVNHDYVLSRNDGTIHRVTLAISQDEIDKVHWASRLGKDDSLKQSILNDFWERVIVPLVGGKCLGD